MVIKGIYVEYQVQLFNYGIGFNIVVIELLLLIYGEQFGLKGKICKYWILNLYLILILVIESGWVESVYCFGGELGMEEYICVCLDIFFIGLDGLMCFNCVFCQLVGQYVVDMFIGLILQVDGLVNFLIVICGCFFGFGGVLNMGYDLYGCCYVILVWFNMIIELDLMQCGKKLVVQMVEIFQVGVKLIFVEMLDVVEVVKIFGMLLVLVMIYGDDVIYVLIEEGIVYLYCVESFEECWVMVVVVVGIIDIGFGVDVKCVVVLCQSGKVVYLEDFGICCSDVICFLLVVGSVVELVEWFDGLYNLLVKFWSW